MNSSPKNIKCVVFDWDGTIVDTMALKRMNIALLFQDVYGVAYEKTLKSLDEHSGIPRKDLFQSIAREHIERSLTDSEFQHLSSAFTAKNLDSFKEHNIFDSSKAQALKRLKGNYLLFVSSAAPSDEILFLSDHLNIRGFFAELLGSFSGFSKGQEHFNYISSHYGFKLEEILFVGQGRAGNAGFENMGIKLARLQGTGSHRKKHDIKSILELENFILGENECQLGA